MSAPLLLQMVEFSNMIMHAHTLQGQNRLYCQQSHRRLAMASGLIASLRRLCQSVINNNGLLLVIVIVNWISEV